MAHRRAIWTSEPVFRAWRRPSRFRMYGVTPRRYQARGIARTGPPARRCQLDTEKSIRQGSGLGEERHVSQAMPGGIADQAVWPGERCGGNTLGLEPLVFVFGQILDLDAFRVFIPTGVLRCLTRHLQRHMMLVRLGDRALRHVHIFRGEESLLDDEVIRPDIDHFTDLVPTGAHNVETNLDSYGIACGSHVTFHLIATEDGELMRMILCGLLVD